MPVNYDIRDAYDLLSIYFCVIVPDFVQCRYLL